MTHNLAFFAGCEGHPAFICSDSQATGEGDKGVVNKLFYRGTNLGTGTGVYSKLIEAVNKINRLGEYPTIDDVTETIIRCQGVRKKSKRKPDFSALVAGLRDGKTELYAVEYERTPIEHFVFGGSGGSQTFPAFQRDSETGNIIISDIAEGMNMCFSYGDKAGHDMYVDDKLQIGVVDRNGVHMLYHPEVGLSERDRLAYMRSFLGPDLKEYCDDSALNVSAVLSDLYTALRRTCGKMNWQDVVTNRMNTLSKVYEESREKHETARTLHMKERDKHKGHVKELADAWLFRDVGKVVQALRTYQERRNAQYDEAIKYAASLKTPAESKPATAQ